MEALAGDMRARAQRVIAAGSDVALHCNGDLTEMQAAAAGVPAQRLLWASTGTKDPTASDVLYVDALAAPDTIITMPDETLLALADHGAANAVLPEDGGDSAAVIAQFVQAGIDIGVLAARLQQEGAQAFIQSWSDLIACIAAKRPATTAVHAA